MREQGFTSWEVLETHTSKSVAERREKELQKKYGYRVDGLGYAQADYTELGKKGGKTAGRIAVESGHISRLGKSGIGGKIGGKKGGKIAGRIAVESGQLASVSTFETRSKGGKKAGKRNAESGQIHDINKKKRKLTQEDAEEIRRIYIKGNRQFSQRALAKQYGVTQPVIRLIIHNKTYLP